MELGEKDYFSGSLSTPLVVHVQFNLRFPNTLFDLILRNFWSFSLTISHREDCTAVGAMCGEVKQTISESMEWKRMRVKQEEGSEERGNAGEGNEDCERDTLAVNGNIENQEQVMETEEQVDQALLEVRIIIFSLVLRVYYFQSFLRIFVKFRHCYHSNI
jgi:hypothetical protein